MSADERFVQFVNDVEPRLRHALVALYGPEAARDAVAEALTYAWQHWKRVEAMANPAGYLYRVAQSRARRPKTPRVLPAIGPATLPEVEPRLPEAMNQLSDRQRVAVLLVHGYGWSHTEAAEFLGVSVSTVRNHLARGLARLRSILEVCLDARD
jgi:DNA-directed RNA polymerase specialized sigma24 family protein